VLAKVVLVLALDDLEVLKNCGLMTKKVLRPFLDLPVKDLKILILDEAKFQKYHQMPQLFCLLQEMSLCMRE